MFNFSKREINVLALGGIFLIVFVAVQFIWSPADEKRSNLERILVTKQDSLKEMEQLEQQFSAASDRFNSKTKTIANRQKGFSLFSLLDFHAQQSGVKENVANMKPFTKNIEKSQYKLATVKVKLKEVYLQELVDFLYHIESPKNGVTVISLSLTKAGKNKKKLDAVFETQTLMLKEEA